MIPMTSIHSFVPVINCFVRWTVVRLWAWRSNPLLLNWTMIVRRELFELARAIVGSGTGIECYYCCCGCGWPGMSLLPRFGFFSSPRPLLSFPKIGRFFLPSFCRTSVAILFLLDRFFLRRRDSAVVTLRGRIWSSMMGMIWIMNILCEFESLLWQSFFIVPSTVPGSNNGTRIDLRAYSTCYITRNLVI